VSRSGVHLGLYNQSNPTSSLRSALGKPQWRQQANSHVTACQTKHVCSDAQVGGRVTKIAGMVNQRGYKITARWMISGLVLKYLNGARFVIRRGYETTLHGSS